MPSLISVKGLNTFDSELSLAEGTLKEATNVVVDRKNTARPRRGFKDYGDTLPLDADRVKQILGYKGLILRHFNETIQFDDGTGTFSDFAGSYSELETGLRIKFRELNGNLYFTTSDGIKRISAKTTDDFTTDAGFIENAGAPKALDMKGKVLYDIAGFLPASSKVAYRVVWGKNDSNSNLLLGAVGSRLIITNTSDDVTVVEKSTIDTAGSTGAGLDGTYFLITGGTGNQYFAWYNNDASGTEPIAFDTIGKTAIEINVLTASTVSEIATFTASALSQKADFDITYSGGTILTITNTSGDATEDIVDGDTPTGLTFAIVEQGQVISGLSARVNLTITVPADVNTTDYFYQVYRTGVFTTSTGVDLIDIDPGDEMNLILESGITDAQITAGEINVDDETSESFREAGALLYTNPQSGDGILQSNEKPPIAKDIASFRNSMFYANTKSVHRLTVNLLSVSGLTSGTTKLVIANSTATREYSFVGVAQEQSFDTVADVAESLDGKYFTVSDSNDEIDFYVWYTTKTDEASDPQVTDRLGIKVQIDTNDSANTVATLTASALDATPYFSATANTNTVDVVWASAGNVVGDITDVDTTFTVSAPSIEGDGEEADTAAGGDVLRSTLLSVGQSIDETARSLVNIINRDSNGIVYAYYLSGPDSLPGIISIESRELTDAAFYMAVNETGAQGMFSPEMDLRQETATDTIIGNPGNINITGHGYVTGDEVFVYGFVTTDSMYGVQTVTRIDDDNFTIPVDVQAVTDGAGFVFETGTPSDNEEKPNRLFYSKTSQPEAVPLLNFIDIGPKDKAIERIIELRDNLYVFKEDGVYIVTGTSIPFQTRLIDSSANITAPDSAAVLNNQIYFLSTQGIATASDAGITIISKPIENLILDATRVGSSYQTTSFGIGYENDRSYLIWMPTDLTDTVATQCFRYSTHNGYWTKWDLTNNCGVVSPLDDKLYLGATDRNSIVQERKTGDRTDYTDREFELTVPSLAVDGNDLEISSATNGAKGDVLVQYQYLAGSQFNRLLKKLDIDVGLDDTDYFTSLEVISGSTIWNHFSSLVDKLNADDDSATTYVYSGTTDFETLQTEYNTVVAQLTLASSDPNFNYDINVSSGITEQESIILSVNKTTNTFTLAFQVPFLEGPITLFTGYECIVEWAPQHFGDASTYKQVKEGSILFDANNFHSATIEFASDRSKNFEGTEFPGKGTGAFGGSKFGNTTFGGEGTDEGIRTIVPRDKQRCRYMSCRFVHTNAREEFNLLGITMTPRQYSTKAYRSGANSV